MLVSESRYGKTQWARSLGEHVYIANMWDLGYGGFAVYRPAGLPYFTVLCLTNMVILFMGASPLYSAFDGVLDDFWHTGYVVFDDIGWDSIKGTAKSWFGAQRDFTVSDKYRRKRRMPGGVPCIFLINPDAYVSDCYNFITGAWGVENIDVVWLQNKLY